LCGLLALRAVAASSHSAQFVSASIFNAVSASVSQCYQFMMVVGTVFQLLESNSHGTSVLVALPNIQKVRPDQGVALARQWKKGKHSS
jgi:hypothetical protein